MKPVTLHEAAYREWEVSAQFYAERDKALAVDFNSRINQALGEIASDPLRFPVINCHYGVRKCPIGRFPFSILYIDELSQFWVVAIAHGSRRPSFWRQRL